MPNMRRNILKDTILLTAIQMILDGLGLLLNAFMTRQLGSESMGILTLTGSFFRLAAMTAGGNVFLCASRFISEELGKPERNPKKILSYCMTVSLILSFVISGLIILFAPWCSTHFFDTDGLTAPIRLMAISMPFVTV
ncbi:MAG: oligosaccharide flippase family protein, partial [Oscillospiraceae bacterium]|nr:oligosaccharide flippase family protein [Oscillospiraceae bacterium]